MDIKANKERYEKLFKEYVLGTKVDDLLKMLNRTDFFTAPASVKYHCNFEGGLCQHSLNVFDAYIRLLQMQAIEKGLECGILERIKRVETLTGDEMTLADNLIKQLLDSQKVSLASVIRVTLGHDFHKINYYNKYLKNVKDETGQWIQQEAWGYRDDHFVLGEDGTNSWYIMNSVMPLTYEEIAAIENHVGSGRAGHWLEGASGCWKKSNLAVLLHLADMYATFVMED